MQTHAVQQANLKFIGPQGWCGVLERMTYAIASILPESGYGSCLYFANDAELGEIQ